MEQSLSNVGQVYIDHMNVDTLEEQGGNYHRPEWYNDCRNIHCVIDRLSNTSFYRSRIYLRRKKASDDFRVVGDYLTLIESSDLFATFCW